MEESKLGCVWEMMGLALGENQMGRIHICLSLELTTLLQLSSHQLFHL